MDVNRYLLWLFLTIGGICSQERVYLEVGEKTLFLYSSTKVFRLTQEPYPPSGYVVMRDQKERYMVVLTRNSTGLLLMITNLRTKETYVYSTRPCNLSSTKPVLANDDPPN